MRDLQRIVEYTTEKSSLLFQGYYETTGAPYFAHMEEQLELHDDLQNQNPQNGITLFYNETDLIDIE